jgi:3-dehydroquinate synthase
MQTLTVELGDRSYPIYIGPGLLNNPDLITPFIKGKSTVTVSNEKVAPLYMDTVQQSLDGLKNCQVVLPDGERFKTLEVLDQIFSGMLENQCDRRTTLLALGGGVVGDMGGFAAACYQRGVNFIQIPTTLLSMVDSSVGGKTGVNHPMGKNMIGAFYQPQCVLIDTDTLRTLDDRELSAGLAEVIKYGLIGDTEFLGWLTENMPALMARDTDALAYAIYRSCQNKATVVAADEREAGQRALLNLGHTFGHAIETGMGYGNWLHGEAVATGTVMAAELSQKMGWLSEADLDSVKQIFIQANLPVEPPASLSADEFMQHMSRDKKVQDGVLSLVLLRQLGEAVLTSDYDPQALRAVLERK